jgi:carboxymethylenebutenolidase
MCHAEAPSGGRPPGPRGRAGTGRARGGEMPAYIAFPAELPAPAIVIVNDVGGLSPFYRHLAERLADAGYVAISPELFHRLGPVAVQPGDPAYMDGAIARMMKLDTDLLFADLGATIDHAAALPQTRARGVGTIGFCMGGTCVLALAVRRPDLRAAVAYYGVPVKRRGVPNVQPLDEVDRLAVPLLAHWGDRDDAVGLDNIERYRDAVAAAQQDAAIHLYPGLGHGFLRAIDDGASPSHDPACLSWSRTLEFFAEHLD